jgi:hypothetical protein
MKISREFVGRRYPSKAGVLPTLLVGQNLDRHFSQNPSTFAKPSRSLENQGVALRKNTMRNKKLSR